MAEARQQPSYTDRHIAYCRAVLDGSTPACRWTKAAAQRQIDDLKRWKKDGEYWFDSAAVDRVCQFVESLPHIKGEWARQKLCLILQDWQVFVLACVFGWKRRVDGTRRFRMAYTEVARKNGKSALLAAVALYLFAADAEAGAEVYSLATTHDQAAIVAGVAKQMTLRDREFREAFGIEVRAHFLWIDSSASTLRAMSADGGVLDGLNVHGGIIDELHAHKTREVWDVIETATGSRQQPLVWAITTAGSNRAGICYEQRGYVCKILNSSLKAHDGLGYEVKGDAALDETYFGIIYTIDDSPQNCVVQSLRDVIRLDNTCSCRIALTTQEKKRFLEVCAEVATTSREAKTHQGAVLSTQTGRSGAGKCAPVVTSNAFWTETLTESVDPLRSEQSGQPATKIESGPLPKDGDLNQRAKSAFSATVDSSSTEFPKSSTRSYSENSPGGARFADKSNPAYAWIITTLRAKLEDYCAGDAIRHSASLEILKRLYSGHSPTCKVPEISRINNSGQLEITHPEDEWVDESSWIKANPNLGVSVKWDDMRRLARKAMQTASAVPNFLTKRLNVWVNADSAWMDMRAWDRQADRQMAMEDFREWEAFIGLDLASKNDFTAMVILFRKGNQWRLFGRYYLPEDAIEASGNSQFQGWAATEVIVETEGNIVDYSLVASDLKEWCEKFNVREVAYDQNFAWDFVQRMKDDGLPMVPVKPLPSEYNEPMRELEAIVLSGRLWHDGNPAMTWMISNVMLYIDNQNRYYPRKESNDKKIDAPVAAMAAINRALSNNETGRVNCFDL